MNDKRDEWWTDAAVAAEVERLNERFMVVDVGGRVRVYQRTRDLETGHWRYGALTSNSFRNLHLDRRVRIGGRVKTLGDVWLQHPNRREYFDVVFKLHEQREDMLNLWQGFACEPKPGDWSYLQMIMRDAICAGNEDHYRYLLAWMARCVQFPYYRSETAVLMRGAGRSGRLLANTMRTLFGVHGFHQPGELYFSRKWKDRLLEQVVLLVVDDDNICSPKFNRFVHDILCSDVLHIRKGQWFIDNHVHLMMTMDDWLPMPDVRHRFLVLDGGDDPGRYIKRAERDLENGGLSGLLQYLLAYDISGFDDLNIPQSSG